MRICRPRCRPHPSRGPPPCLPACSPPSPTRGQPTSTRAVLQESIRFVFDAIYTCTPNQTVWFYVLFQDWKCCDANSHWQVSEVQQAFSLESASLELWTSPVILRAPPTPRPASAQQGFVLCCVVLCCVARRTPNTPQRNPWHVVDVVEQSYQPRSPRVTLPRPSSSSSR